MNKLAKYIIAIAAAAIILFLIWYFGDVVAYILISAVLAVMGHRLVDLICKLRIGKLHIPRWLSAMVVVIIMWGVAILFFSTFIPLIFGKLRDLLDVDFTQFTDYIEKPTAQLSQFLNEYFKIDTTQFSLSDTIADEVRDIFNANKINSLLSSTVSTLASLVIDLFSITFITYFFLKEENLFTSMMLAIFPTKYEDNVKRALDSVTYLLSRYFVGILAESCIMMLLVSGTLMLCGFGVSNAFFVGSVVGVFNVIPYLGPWIGVAIGVLAGVTFSIPGMTVATIAITIGGTVLGAQMIDNFVIQPLLYSKQVKAHPLEIFIVILIAGYLAGVLGMLLAIPSYTVLRVFAKEFFNNYKLVQKLTVNIPDSKPKAPTQG